MNSIESVTLQRLLALLSLGMSDALENGTISIGEAEQLLFSPHTMRCCKGIGASSDLIDLIHVGTELDAIKDLLSSDQWKTSLDKIRMKARKVLEVTAASDSQQDKWIERMIVKM